MTINLMNSDGVVDDGSDNGSVRGFDGDSDDVVNNIGADKDDASSVQARTCQVRMSRARPSQQSAQDANMTINLMKAMTAAMATAVTTTAATLSTTAATTLPTAAAATALTMPATRRRQRRLQHVRRLDGAHCLC